ncbi:MAG: hypothetical protein J0M12_13075 [Deltaproteobacteria bacterium]|nr:hypothetical protein [Deltaproteobacteria bacterium]
MLSSQPGAAYSTPTPDQLRTVAGTATSYASPVDPPATPERFEFATAHKQIDAALVEKDYSKALTLAQAARQSLYHATPTNYQELCTILCVIGNTLHALDRPQEAIEVLREALGTANQQAFEDPTVTPQIMIGLAIGLLRQAADRGDENFSESRTLLKEGLRRYAALYNCSPQDFPNIQGDYREELVHTAKVESVTTLIQFSEICALRDMPRHAHRLASSAVALSERVLGKRDPNSNDARWSLMSTARALEYFSQEEALIRHSLELIPNSASPSDLPSLILKGRLADVLMRQDKHSEVEALARPILEAFQGQALPEESRSPFTFLHQSLGRAAEERHDLDTARSHYALAIEVEKSLSSTPVGVFNVLLRSLARTHEKSAEVWRLLGDKNQERTENAEALKLHRAAVQLADAAGPNMLIEQRKACKAFLEILDRQGYHAEAQEQADRFVDLTGVSHGVKSFEYADALSLKADILEERGLASEGEPRQSYFSASERTRLRCIEILKAQKKQDPQRVLSEYKNLKTLALHMDAPVAATQYLEDARDYAAARTGRQSVFFASASLSLADEFVNQENYSEAEKQVAAAYEALMHLGNSPEIFLELGRYFHLQAVIFEFEAIEVDLEEIVRSYRRAEEYFTKAAALETIAYSNFLMDSGNFYQSQYEAHLRKADLTRALRAFSKVEELWTRWSTNATQDHIDLLERDAELQERNSDYEQAARYSAKAQEISAKLEQGAEEE